jgi:thioredoxin 1
VSEHARNLSGGELQRLIAESELPVVADFWAPWCPPCRRLGPTVEQLAREFEGRVVVVKVNIDDDAAAPGSFDIRSIPALLFFRDGKLVERRSGAASHGELKDAVERLLETR